MGLFGKKKEVTSINLIHIDGVSGYGKGTAISINLDDSNKCLTINARVYEKPLVHLSYEQIVDIDAIDEEKIIEKSKSTVGRALAGGILLGPLGAIIGGMSGIGTNKTSSTTYYMIINYKSQDGEIKVLSFKINGGPWSKFIWSVRHRIKTEEIPKEIYL